MSITVGRLAAWLEEVAPAELAEAWDCVGLQIGSPEAEVGRVLLTVDVTRQVLEAAARKQAGAIIAHHPVLLGEIGSLRQDRWPGCVVGPLIEGRRALLVAHTNLDWSPRANTSGALAEALGLRVAGPLQSKGGEGAGYLGVVSETEPVALSELAARAREALGTEEVRLRGQSSRRVRRLAVVAGSAKGLLAAALNRGVEAVVTGELGHHAGLEAAEVGLGVVEAGHSASEQPGMARLAELLEGTGSVECEVLSDGRE